MQNMPMQAPFPQSMPGMPMQNLPMQNLPMQNIPPQNLPMQAAFPQLKSPPPPTSWQSPPRSATPSLGYLASGVTPTLPKQPAPALASMQPLPTTPAKIRGVAAELPPATVLPSAPSAPSAPKFVLPGPEELGVATSLSLPKQSALQTQPAINWNQVHTRMERLGVLRYEKVNLPAGGVRVTLLLPTADPTRAQPLEATAATEAAAILVALQGAETWMQPR